MALALNANPYVRTKRSTPQIMIELLIGLALVWITSIIFYFSQGKGLDGLLAILNVVICVIACAGTEILFLIPKWKKEAGHNFKSLLLKEFNSFGYISGIILELLMPIMTNANVGIHIVNLIVTCVISIGAIKMLFGGFGHNIFNVALVGRVFATLCYGSTFVHGHVEAGKEIVSAGATLLTTWNGNGWNMVGTFNGPVDLLDLLFGFRFGALGETFTLVILVVGIILAIRKVIDWKLSVFYLGTCFLSALIVGAVNNADLMYGNPGNNLLTFAVAQIFTGGIMFGAVFCITDPVTAPTNPLAKMVYAAVAGFLTMLIRFQGNSAEGVAFSILTVNMLAPLIANFFKGRTTVNLPKKLGISAGISVLLVLVSCTYSNIILIPTYQATVTHVEENTYNVKVDHPYTGEKNNYVPVNLDVTVDPANRLVTSVTVYEQGTNAGGGYGDYFLGLTDQVHIYGEAKIQKLEGLMATLISFDQGGISFDAFTKYDFSFYDKKNFSSLNDFDPNNEIIGCGATYTVAGYIYGVNAVIETVEAQ